MALQAHRGTGVPKLRTIELSQRGRAMGRWSIVQLRAPIEGQNNIKKKHLGDLHIHRILGQVPLPENLINKIVRTGVCIHPPFRGMKLAADS